MGFNPDYICPDPECKIRKVVMDMSEEYQARIQELESQLEIAREHLDFFFRLANDKGISDQGKLVLVRCKVKGKTFTDFLATLDKKPGGTDE